MKKKVKTSKVKARKPFGLKWLIVLIAAVILGLLLRAELKAADNYGPTTFTATADTFAPLRGSSRGGATSQPTGTTGTAAIPLGGTVAAPGSPS